MPRVRYVGLPDPVVENLEGIRSAIAAGKLTVDQVYEYQARRLGAPKPEGGFYPVLAAIPGVTARRLGPNEGLSTTVQWGSKLESFVQEVSADDWSAIQALPEAAHFRLED